MSQKTLPVEAPRTPCPLCTNEAEVLFSWSGEKQVFCAKCDSHQGSIKLTSEEIIDIVRTFSINTRRRKHH